MSYSRFSHSVWYTFWAVASYGVIEDRDNAKFEVMHRSTGQQYVTTAKALREDPVRLGIFARHECECRDSEWYELRNYVEEFLLSVDAKYVSATAR